MGKSVEELSQLVSSGGGELGKYRGGDNEDI